jgi:hypothetical protein
MFCIRVGADSKDDDEAVEGAVCPKRVSNGEFIYFILNENSLLQITCVLFIIKCQCCPFRPFLSVSWFHLND